MANTNETNTVTKEDTKVSKIDAAIAAAKARKADKEAKGNASPKAEKPAKAPAKAKATDADREVAKAKLTADRETRKAEKATAREAKLAEKAAAKKPAHLAKVARAAEKLPALAETAQVVFSDATSNLSRGQLAALALHINHFNRVKATERSLTSKLEAGMAVTIVGGDARFIGMTGTVDKAQRIRCYVTVPGQAKAVYLFTSDVDVAATPTAATGTADLGGRRQTTKMACGGETTVGRLPLTLVQPVARESARECNFTDKSGSIKSWHDTGNSSFQQSPSVRKRPSRRSALPRWRRSRRASWSVPGDSASATATASSSPHRSVSPRRSRIVRRSGRSIPTRTSCTTILRPSSSGAMGDSSTEV